LKSTRQERVLKDRRKALALEADTKRTVGIPRAAAAAAAAPLFCSSFAAGKQKKGAGKTERVKNESEKREREEAEVADAEQNYKAEEAAG
jgi:hypothetical protein